MARPSKLTPEIQAQICALIREGNWAYVAAETAGIHRRTYFNWMSWGRKARERGEHSKYRQFWQAIQRAASEFEVLMVGHIHRAALEGNLDAAKWWLVHRFPGRWGLQKSRLEHGAEGGGPVTIKVIRAAPRPQKETAGQGEKRSRDVQ